MANTKDAIIAKTNTTNTINIRIASLIIPFLDYNRFSPFQNEK
jgi:hypothetical protein